MVASIQYWWQRVAISQNLYPMVNPKTGHFGRCMMLNKVRGCGFWIFNANALTRSLIYHCVKCRSLGEDGGGETWRTNDDKDELFFSDTPRAGFEPAQKLSSGSFEWSCEVVITTTPRCHEMKSELRSGRLQEPPSFTYCGIDLISPFTINNYKKELKR